MLLASGITDVSTIGIIFAAAGGTVAALVALLKLRGETGQLAVSQAQGAMETMVELNDQLEKALTRANTRADRYRDERDVLQKRHDAAVERWGPFPE